jgi:hypothetical protein
VIQYDTKGLCALKKSAAFSCVALFYDSADVPFSAAAEEGVEVHINNNFIE